MMEMPMDDGENDVENEENEENTIEKEKEKKDMDKWPLIDTQDISHNVVNVPVTIDDNGVEYKSMLF